MKMTLMGKIYRPISRYFEQSETLEHTVLSGRSPSNPSPSSGKPVEEKSAWFKSQRRRGTLGDQGPLNQVSKVHRNETQSVKQQG